MENNSLLNSLSVTSINSLTMTLEAPFFFSLILSNSQKGVSLSVCSMANNKLILSSWACWVWDSNPLLTRHIQAQKALLEALYWQPINHQLIAHLVPCCCLNLSTSATASASRFASHHHPSSYFNAISDPTGVLLINIPTTAVLPD